MSLRYYQDEMRYLQEAGRAFAEAHPEHARLLDVDSLADRDPYVERLFEGFALLAGRIHERLDDELPEYTDGLLALVWPQLLRPVPSLTVVEFRPAAGLVQQTTPIPRGTEVRSAPVGDEQAPCRFTTTQEVRLQPFRLVDATTAWPREGATSLTLRFRLDRGADFARLDRSAVRLYLHADPAAASLMHLFLTRHVERVAVRAAGADAGVELAGQRWVRGGGFAADEALVPRDPHAFDGFRPLQEYLAFRQKFWFVDLLGLDRFEAPPRMAEFEVALHFGRALPERQRFAAESLRLGCTPAVNLFAHDGEPLAVDHRSAEYRVTPDVHRPLSVEAWAVERVRGVEDGTGRRHDYGPRGADGAGRPGRRWFTAARRPAAGGRSALHLALGGAPAAELRPEKVSLELRCTNGDLPRERLGEHAITEPGPDMPRLAAVDNLTRPTRRLEPPAPDGRDRLWRLLSHLSLGHRSVATRDGIAELLSLHDWTGEAPNRQRAAAVRAVAWRPREVVRRRACVRGAEVALEVADGGFADEGDLCLFGEVLSRVLSAYATINSFVHLAIVAVPSGERYAWRPDGGTSPLL